MQENPKKTTGLKRRIAKEAEELRHTARQKTLQYILAAFGLVAGLAWNDAIRTFIEVAFPLQANTVIAKFIYAVFMTVVVVGVSIYLAKLFRDANEDKTEK